MLSQELQNPSRTWLVGFDSSQVTQSFEFDPARGIISNKLRNNRVFLLGADVWQDVEDEMFHVFSAGAYIILKKIGRAYGTSVARKLKGEVSSISVLKQLASSAGWGKFFVRLDDEMGSWIRIDVKNCVFCHGSEEAFDEGCSFLAGMIQGMAEEFYDKEYSIVRKKCYTTEEPEFAHTCEIVLQQASGGSTDDISKKLDWVAIDEKFR
jgi:predicted hydrocarbon binding protein